MNSLKDGRWSVPGCRRRSTALKLGHVHIGNPWEGRTNARIADLRRKISNLDQLIKTENTRKV
jgi:hypothetical protein